MDPLKIIVADDHPLFREGLEQALLRLNPAFTIFSASNGREIFDILEKEIIDLIFLDIRMAFMDGIEITRQIRKTNDHVKIVAVTMIDDRVTVVKVFQAGANGFLHKNTEKCKLQHVIEVVMNNQLYLSDEIADYEPDVVAQTKTPMHPESYDTLSEREIEILLLICGQCSTREIAQKLHLTEKTVETHRVHLMWKTRSKNVVGLTMFAIEKGYILPEYRKKV